MELTPDEIEQGAELLCKSALKKSFSDLPSNERMGLRILVRKLAKLVAVPHSPEAVTVFMAWMGENNPMVKLWTGPTKH